ncbi:Serine/threonine-protein kinase StkP [Rubripirellula lacrimiformis]|uniref:Serine/threonine-protein kinase StkP n=1 Tax=Rubripirellula lacrimiformis TaxID=1930273 RepID=A0A517NLE6_9BACT|nr:serine/threonine-protein kinase [Rubripirellula lacrimiformis]QDT07955.1 Serine/threonine-protein kinase StkP [Rubripirellula lacrimiformis]
MIATTHEHPSDEELVDFGFGRVPPDRFERLMQHLDSCQSCQQRMDASSLDDSFAAVLSAEVPSSDDAVLAEADCQAAIFHAAGPQKMRLDPVLPPVDSLGPYRLLRPLGRGGMGAVYLAEHTRLKRKCAIKLLPRGHGFDSVWVNRFEREMQAVAALSHPGIVTATDAGDSGGWHYLVMEYLDGLDLAAIVRRLGPLDIAAATTIMRGVCRAIAAVHDRGLVHRDIKPSNIMLTSQGTVKLLDLGLVLDQSQPIADLRLTTVGHVIGTLAFAAPEQLSDGDSVDSRADLYSIGATLYQLIAGHPAHDSSRGIAPLVIDKTTRPADRLKDAAAEVPPALDDLVSQLLSRDRDDRPDQAHEVADRLDAFTRSVSLKPLIRQAMRAEDPEPMLSATLPIPNAASGEPPRPNRTLIGFLGGAAAAAILATIIITIQSDKTRVRIETDDPNLAVQVSQSPTVASADPNVALGDTDESAAPIVPSKKRFKGETIDHWVGILETERDVDTLGEAINAVVSLADESDVDAVGAILRSARRFGGWTASADKSEPSQLYMTQFIDTIKRIMPSPGIEAITAELGDGNQNSRAACLWALLNFEGGFSGTASSRLLAWADDPQNKQKADALHQALRSLTDDDLHFTQSISTARDLSLKLAIALNAPLDEEPGLSEEIDQNVTKAKSMPPIAERLEDPFPGGRNTTRQANFSVYRFIAAKQLGIELPPALEVQGLLDDALIARDKRHQGFLDQLKKTPAVYADEALLWLYTKNPNWLASPSHYSGQTFIENQDLWTKALPIIVENTTRPDMAGQVMDLVLASVGTSISEDARKLLQAARDRCEERFVAEPGENSNDPFSAGSESPFGEMKQPHSSGGGMF